MKEVITSSQQAENPSIWKWLKIIFSPSWRYQIFEPLLEKTIILVMHVIVEETSLSLSEEARQSIQSNSPNVKNEK